jgi:hypothetical protein
MKKKLLLTLFITINLSSCDDDYGLHGPFEYLLNGFWKQKEIQDTNGKISSSLKNHYFFNEASSNDPNVAIRDSIIFYTDKVPTMATAMAKSIERSQKYRKKIALLDDGSFISIQFFSDQMATDVYLEIIRANTLDSLSKSPIERYKPIGQTRVW